MRTYTFCLFPSLAKYCFIRPSVVPLGIWYVGGCWEREEFADIESHLGRAYMFRWEIRSSGAERSLGSDHENIRDARYGLGYATTSCLQPRGTHSTASRTILSRRDIKLHLIKVVYTECGIDYLDSIKYSWQYNMNIESWRSLMSISFFWYWIPHICLAYRYRIRILYSSIISTSWRGKPYHKLLQFGD